MRFTVFLLVSILIHTGMFISVSFDQEPVESPEVFVRKGRTVIRMTIVPPQPEQKKQEITEPEEEAVIPESSIVIEEEQTEQPPESTLEAESGSSEDGAVSEAAMIGRSQPPYPLLSRRRGEEGTVRILVTISENGTCVKAHLLESSGFSRLDRSAMEWAKTSTYNPGTRDGKPVRSELKLKVPFELE